MASTSYQRSKILCMALMLMPALSMADSMSVQNPSTMDVLEYIAIKTNASKPSIQASPEKVRAALKSVLAMIQSATSKKTFEEAKAVFPPSAARALSPEVLAELSNVKVELASGTELQIQTSKGLIRLEVQDLENGMISLNGKPLSLKDFATENGLRVEIRKILDATLPSSTQHAAWELISSASASGFAEPDPVGVVAAILTFVIPQVKAE